MMSTFGKAYRPKSPIPISAPIKLADEEVLLSSSSFWKPDWQPHGRNPAYPNHLKGLAIITISNGIE
jgi:hypothetical protein